MASSQHRQPIALLGKPVSHSLSPTIHNFAFRLTSQPYFYLALEVEPKRIRDAVRGLAALGFRGANVTIPHKRAVIDFLDDLTPQARATGAVNTIVCDQAANGEVKLMGDNTDIAGFLAPLELVREQVVERPAVVLGSGGAARAVIHALQTALRSQQITVVTRSVENASDLLSLDAAAGSARVELLPYDQADARIADASLVINATPVGMSPNVDQSPLSDHEVLNSSQIVYDLIYSPTKTRLLEEAAARGAKTIGGLKMLIAQAAASYVRWTGVEMPVTEVEGELQRQLVSPGN